MKRSASLCGLLALVLMLFAVRANAQEQVGSIEGVVKDTSGAVLPGVSVEAKNPQGTIVTATSDETGQYRFPALKPGKYTVTATLSGFKKVAFENIDLLLGQVLKVNFDMAVGLTEEVQVTAESPIIDVKQNAATQSITTDLIERIPKGRNFTSVINVAPGANDETRNGGIQFDGSSGSENRFVIDGMDTTNLQNGTSGKTVFTEFLQEVQVKTSGYAAEHGGSTGGVVNAISKTEATSIAAASAPTTATSRCRRIRARPGASTRLPIAPRTGRSVPVRPNLWRHLTRSSTTGIPLVTSAGRSCATRPGFTSGPATTVPTTSARRRSATRRRTRR